MGKAHIHPMVYSLRDRLLEVSEYVSIKSHGVSDGGLPPWEDQLVCLAHHDASIFTRAPTRRYVV
jgi:hypothetical protein